MVEKKIKKIVIIGPNSAMAKSFIKLYNQKEEKVLQEV